MRYHSTRNKNPNVSFTEAALCGLAPDGGLFVPETLPVYSSDIKSSLPLMDFPEIACNTIHPWVKDDIPLNVLEDICKDAFSFPVPLVKTEDRFVLELFHGPTAAFKDFGARFMARAFSYLRRGEDKPLKILVATSGDTGGAVADGFFGIDGISVTVLYPKGRISPLQEKQIAGLGGNISALAVEGSFDDCQVLVKKAFSENSLNKKQVLSSANSINISRLIPQAAYYTSASVKLISEYGYKAGAMDSKPLISVPSGNFGNLTAGLYAYKMGAPIKAFIAATNINKTVPDYLDTGNYFTRDSHATISNAMDVGTPSNFERMASHFSLEEMRNFIYGVSVNDEDTMKTISEVFSSHAYCLDPHTAVGWHGADILKSKGKLSGKNPLVIISTAHPAKFDEVVEPITGAIPFPPSLKNAMERKADITLIPNDFNSLMEFLQQ